MFDNLADTFLHLLSLKRSMVWVNTTFGLLLIIGQNIGLEKFLKVKKQKC